MPPFEDPLAGVLYLCLQQEELMGGWKQSGWLPSMHPVQQLSVVSHITWQSFLYSKNGVAQSGWALCCSQMTDNTLLDMASFIWFSFLSLINLKRMQL